MEECFFIQVMDTSVPSCGSVMKHRKIDHKTASAAVRDGWMDGGLESEVLG